MDRRHFVKSLGALGSISLLPGGLPLAKVLSQSDTGNWASAFQSVEQDQFSPITMRITGKIPEDFQGTLFRNGPALFRRGGITTEHWFDGDGMIQKYSINANGITHQGSMVQTERYLKEQAANKFLYQHAGTHVKDTIPIRNNDTTNQANIAVMKWQDELLALWEGGSAYRLNIETLETLGRKDWRDDLMHVPFSAHPLMESNGRMWNFGFAPFAGNKGALLIYDISLQNGIERVAPIELPFAGYIHDFAQTEQHLIFLIPPYHYQHSGGDTYVSRYKWQPQLGSRLLVIDKNDLQKQQWFELEPGFVFHFGNAWQKGHQLGINMCWYEDPSIMQMTRQQRIEAEHLPLDKQAKVSTVLVDLNTKKVAQMSSDTVMEFPSFKEHSYGSDVELIGVGVNEKFGERADALTHYQPHSGRTAYYRYPTYVVAEEPLLVGSALAPEKYVVQTYVDLKAQQTGLNIFRKDAISDGPIVNAQMERLIPLGFHGTFINS